MEQAVDELIAACVGGDLPAVRRILADDPTLPRRRNSDSFLQIHPLGCAVASPNVPNPSDDEFVVLRLVNLLLDKGAAVNAQRRDGMTALHSAAYRGHLKVIRRLLDAGADRTIRAHGAGSHVGESPADTALAQGQTAAAELLRS